MSIIRSCLSILLADGIVSKVNPTVGEYLSKIFTVKKPNGKYRFILNLKEFNKFVLTTHFKLEDLRTAIKLVEKDSFMISIDLKDAYFSIPIAKTHKKYLRFLFQQEMYEFNFLPFGLCTAPYIFTKIMRPVVAHFRSKGFQLVNYLDDFLIIDSDFHNLIQQATYAVELLQNLGFVVNFEKSCLVPKRSCQFLGLILNSRNLTVEVPLDKRKYIKDKIQMFLIKKECKIRELAHLIGKLISVCPGIAYGVLHTKIFERHKMLALQASNGNFESRLNIPECFKDDLTWWYSHIDNSVNKIHSYKFSIEIYSDASEMGWGAVCGTEKIFGCWNDEEKSFHINYLELKAAFLALQYFTKSVQNTEILFRIDNRTAIACINKMGSVQYTHLHSIARQFWEVCEARNLWVFASYISSKENIADQVSRRYSDKTELELSSEAFNTIKSKFGEPNIDLFASALNKKCQRYVSWRRDSDAFAVDAFTINWRKFYFYAFPNFSLILRCLQKIKNDQAVGIIVVPLWPAQAWFPLLNKLRVSEFLEFKAGDYLLNYRDHSILQDLTLGAAKLSGRPTT